ncbi:MAG: ATP-binding protein [Polyangiaceae bacterium]|jgi:ABC-type transport system involved in cytochrome c biogenesis ATPase subunit|nr:ATP-binding protein [Polyangiaceae bacterium]
MTYQRTCIQRLEIQNFRSIKQATLPDIPELVVLHGPNGSGKSNLLRALQLLLKVAGEMARYNKSLVDTRDQAWQLPLQDADHLLDLSRDDFHRGATPEIQIRADIQVGDRGLKRLAIEHLTPFTIHLHLVIQLISDSTLWLWFPRAETSNGFVLGTDRSRGETVKRGASLQARRNALQEQLESVKQQLKSMERERDRPGVRIVSESDFINRRATLSRIFSTKEEAIKNIDEELRLVPPFWSNADLFAERILNELLKDLLLTSEAERRVDREPLQSQQKVGLQQALVKAALSENEEKAQAIHRLGRALGRVKLFGASTPERVDLRPVQSETLREYRVMFKPAGQAEIPLKNLGSGEQQVVMMLADQVLATAPVLLMEEPEAHLHKDLMEPLADYLRASVKEEDGSRPETDQLWIATHHHYFAIADTYLDVSLVGGETNIRSCPRAHAPPRHFYEPGPFWDALKDMLGKGLQREDVLFTDQTGRSITAGQLRDAIQSESLRDEESYRLAREFVEFANKTLIMSLHPIEEAASHDELRIDLPGGR